MKKKTVYKCPKCENIIESLWDGNVNVKCCDTEMTVLEPNTVDASKEKHVPVIERKGDEVTVKVGSALHPMDPDHYILFVEVIDGDTVLRHDFTESDKEPVAVFNVKGNKISARAYCNKHGFWQS